MTYEPPEIALLGSVRELTQAEFLESGSDSTSFFGLFGGDDPVYS